MREKPVTQLAGFAGFAAQRWELVDEQLFREAVSSSTKQRFWCPPHRRGLSIPACSSPPSRCEVRVKGHPSQEKSLAVTPMAGGRVGVRPGEDVGLGPLALADVVFCPSWALMPCYTPSMQPLRLAPDKALADTGQSPLR